MTQATSSGQGSVGRTFECVLQIARASVIDRGGLAQLLEPPCTDPYARWCSRGQRATAAPMPINVFYRVRKTSPKLGRGPSENRPSNPSRTPPLCHKKHNMKDGGKTRTLKPTNIAFEI